MKRRKFVKRSLVASTSALVPVFFTQCMSNKEVSNEMQVKSRSSKKSSGHKKLVVIQLSGGNDGLNTIIPYGSDLYYKSRPKIHIPKKEIIKQTDYLGFHPALSSMASIFDKSEMTIFNSVGYPNADRSHFRSMDIWQSGFTDLKKMNTGWIGRYLDSSCNNSAAIEIEDTISLALKGATCNGLSFSDINKLRAALQEASISNTLKKKAPNKNEKVDYLYKTIASTGAKAEYLYQNSKTYKSTTSYPDSGLGQDLKLIAKLMTGDIDTKIYYSSHTGFDTHANQKNKHAKLLTELSDALGAFVLDLKNHGLFNETAILVFSEFGRRIKENGSKGTDHGKGNNLFVLGGNLAKGGFYNAPTDIVNVDEGDVKYEIDFRSVYQSLLNDWLEIDAQNILQNQYQKLNIFS